MTKPHDPPRTIITANGLILTGNIAFNQSNERGIFHHDADKIEFVTIELTSPPLLSPGNAGTPVLQPFYTVGNRLRINTAQLVDIGPSHID